MDALPLPPERQGKERRWLQVVTFLLLLACSIYFTVSLLRQGLPRHVFPLPSPSGIYRTEVPIPAMDPPTIEELLKTAKKGADGNYYPPSFLPKAANQSLKVKAGFIVLVRNRELEAMRESMKQVEQRFNHKFGYPWVFLNDQPFTEKFKRGVRAMTDSEVRFGLVPKEHWSYPEWISEEKAAEVRKDMESKVVYGGSESYRHMCRFQSGFFFRHPLTLDLDFYWRVEPGIEIRCDVDYDPFVFMAINNKTYGFTIAAHEFEVAVSTLYGKTKEFISQHPESLDPRAGIHFLTNRPDVNKIAESSWNMCHFWSNFEIGDLRFWRSKVYLDYFDFLDKAGGFFYERWGDAPVHTLAATLFQDKSKVHHFDDIGYYHKPWDHCPRNAAYHKGRCNCNPNKSFDLNGYSCLSQWWRGADEKTPSYVVPRSLYPSRT